MPHTPFYIRWLCAVVFFLFSMPLYAELKKVTILPFKNIDQNPNYGYLEESLTSAVRTYLHERFSFQEPDQKVLEDFLQEHYYYKDELYTKNTAQQVGIGIKQDVVIAGGFRTQKNKRTRQDEILTTVYIFDIPNRKLVDTLTLTAVVDANIFDSLNTIAGKIATAAKKLLPTPEEAASQSYASTTPLFQDFTLALDAGGGLFAAGVANRLQVQQPVLALSVATSLPRLSPRLWWVSGFTYLQHTPKSGENPAVEHLELTMTNYMLSSALAYEFFRGSNFSFFAGAGPGVNVQTSIPVANAQASVLLLIPLTQIELETEYRLQRNIGIVFSLRSIAMIEKPITLLNTASVGVKIHW
ncbi:MAG: hypothetical protein LDLANPLL_01489 [Turneriella sp.]|nr:hypothetical protein [Turneriella sp.]